MPELLSPQVADAIKRLIVEWHESWGYGYPHNATQTGVASDTVTEETTAGGTATPGTSTDYSRGDHGHGTPAAGGGGAPTDADYLVGTANGDLSAEIVVGTTPGGELGGTWGSPTVDATHSGSAHHAQAHASDHTNGTDDIQDAAADDSTKGIATFEADDFDSASGKIDLAASVTKSFPTDSGTATPTAHALTIAGGEGIDTSGSSTTVTITGEDASDTNKGIVELATIAETDTGTDTGRAVTPDGLQGSVRNLRFIDIRIVAADTDVATGTDLFGDWVVPYACTLTQDDSNPYWFCAWTDTAGTTGTMVVDVNKNGTTVMSTNKLDIETTEKSTGTAATQPDLTTTDLAAGDILTFDVDAIHTTAAKGLVVRLALLLD